MRIRSYGLTESDFPDAWEFKEMPRGCFWDCAGDMITGTSCLAAIDTVSGEAIAAQYVGMKKIQLTRLKLNHLKLPLTFGNQEGMF